MSTLGAPGRGKIKANLLSFVMSVPGWLISIVPFHHSNLSSSLIPSPPSSFFHPSSLCPLSPSLLYFSVVSQPNRMLKVMGQAGGQELIAAGATEPGGKLQRRGFCVMQWCLHGDKRYARSLPRLVVPMHRK